MGKGKPKWKDPVRQSNSLIGIRFPDNDFTNTIRRFLLLFVDSALVIEPQNVTKARIADLFNRLAPGLYWLCQNGYQYGLDWNPESYLRITEENVFLGEECLQYMETCNGQNNGEFHYIDLGQKKVFSF